ncbi:hypothetical protein DV515_00006516, partial [Chloebia gouldiae]
MKKQPKERPAPEDLMSVPCEKPWSRFCVHVARRSATAVQTTERGFGKPLPAWKIPSAGMPLGNETSAGPAAPQNSSDEGESPGRLGRSRALHTFPHAPTLPGPGKEGLRELFGNSGASGGKYINKTEAFLLFKRFNTGAVPAVMGGAPRSQPHLQTNQSLSSSLCCKALVWDQFREIGPQLDEISVKIGFFMTTDVRVQ